MDEDEKAEERIEAREAVHYILLAQTMADICMLSHDPLMEARHKATRLLNALEHASDAHVGSEWFSHYSIDEMEKFWKRVNLEIELQLRRRRRI